MDAGLREAILLAKPGIERPHPLECLIDDVRECQRAVRDFKMNPNQAKRFMKLARRSGRSAASFLPPGGELRELLLSGEMIPEEDWERLVGPGYKAG